MEREPFNTELPGVLFELAVYLSSEVSISSPHFTQSDATLSRRCRARSSAWQGRRGSSSAARSCRASAAPTITSPRSAPQLRSPPPRAAEFFCSFFPFPYIHCNHHHDVAKAIAPPPSAASSSHRRRAPVCNTSRCRKRAPRAAALHGPRGGGDARLLLHRLPHADHGQKGPPKRRSVAEVGAPRPPPRPPARARLASLRRDGRS